MSDLVALVGIFLLLVLAALLAMSETAISRTNRVKALHLAQEKKPGAEALVRIVEDPARYLNVVLLLTLVAHITGTALATGMAIERWGTSGEAVAASVMTFVIFVFAEVVPKTYTVQRTEKAALMMARPVLLLGRLFNPVGKILIAISNLALLVLPGKAMAKGPF
ncbi:MAG: CNNM domain-containing protein, partial [Actinomycetota bacterium]